MSAPRPASGHLDRRVARAWTRLAGFGNGRIAATGDRVAEICSVVGIGQSVAGRGTVSTRVRRIRRGARAGLEVVPDEVEALWCVPGEPRVRVTLALELESDIASGDGIEFSLAGWHPVGTLDRSPRPRAVDSANAELDSGVVLRSGDVAGTLLMRKPDLAVLAIVAGWPHPRALPHGQDAAEVAALDVP